MRVINQRVLEYIRNYVNQGYSVDRIKQFLLANNVSAQDINEAIAVLSQSQNNFSNPILENQIRNYIKTQLTNGFALDAIKNSLLSQGVDASIIIKISSEFSNVSNRNNQTSTSNNIDNNINVKHEVNVSKGTVIGIVAAVFFVGILVFGFLNFGMLGIFNKTAEPLLDIAIISDGYNYKAGETINYQLHITNMGSLQRFDATIKYLILDDANNVITRKEETIAVQTTASVNRKIIIPQTAKSGKYYLQAIADYGGNKQAKSTIELDVSSKTDAQSNIENTSRDNTARNSSNTTSTTPVLVNNASFNDPTPSNNGIPDNSIIPISNGVTKTTTTTFGTIISEVRTLAASNPEDASIECNSLAKQDQKDICYSTIADSSQLVTYCDKIATTSYKDNCYLSFVMKGNIDICSKISDANNKKFCEQLVIVQSMNRYYKENNTEKILELSKEFNPNVYNSNPSVQTYEHTYSEPVTVMDIFTEES